MAASGLNTVIRFGFLIGLGLCASAPAAAREAAMKLPHARVETLNFAALAGWSDDDHAAAYGAFLKSCSAILQGNKKMRTARPLYGALFKVCERTKDTGLLDGKQAHAFFEDNFKPVRIAPPGQTEGFFTGYYETEFVGSRVPTDEFKVPIYAAPADAVRKRKSKVFAHFDRTAIENGALKGKKLEICYVKNPVDAFFAQIQGSTRVKLDNGQLLRLNYVASNGHRYTPVGKFLIDRGIVAKEDMSMDRIRDWMDANPEEGRELRRRNRSFVFFRETALAPQDECIGAQGIPLTAGRSLAVDRKIHVYGTPIWIDADLPILSEKPDTRFRRLLIAQDTGSAIIGSARADIYFGAGEEIGHVAGRIKQYGQFVMLVPRHLAVNGSGGAPAQDIPLPQPRPKPIITDAAPTTTVSAREAAPLPKRRP